MESLPAIGARLHGKSQKTTKPNYKNLIRITTMFSFTVDTQCLKENFDWLL
jgi:hypothetical protein